MTPSNPTIEPLTEADEPALRALLQRDPFYNLFMIGDLDTMSWDVEALAELYASAGRMRRGADALLRTLEMGRIFVTLDEGRIVSAALTTVETRSAVMIGGVFTPQHWRNRGYASAAMTHLCTDLLAEGRQPCLFYDNPAAGAIYRRLGFQDIGPWHLVFLTPHCAEQTQKS